MNKVTALGRVVRLSMLSATMIMFVLLGVPTTWPVAATQPAKPSAPNKAQIAQNYGELPLSFEANRGQTDPQVRFLSRGNGYSLFLTDSAAVLALTKKDASKGKPKHGLAAGMKPASAGKSGKTDVVRMELAGASRTVHVEGAEQLPGTANYFIGSDPAKWHRSVPTYARVQYVGVYPGVDLVYYGNQRQLEYDFVVAPGADPKPIRLQFAGAEKLKLNRDGNLTVSAKNGEIAFHRPVVYQRKDGQQEPVEGRFVLVAKNTVGFKLGDYDASRAVVIDPTLAYSTYLGGSGYHIPAGPDCCGDNGTSIAVDSAGSAYVAGVAASSNFPVTPGAFWTTDNPNPKAPYDNGVAFVSRLNAAGTALIYSTYLGGSGDYSYGDAARAIAVDSFGDAFVTGFTGSSGDYPNGFPTTTGAYQTTNKAAVKSGSYSAFVSKLSPDGTTLLYSTYLGGSGFNTGVSSGGDAAHGIALDGLGNAFVVGTAFSKDFPVTPGAFQSTNKAAAILCSNIFVTKLNPTGTALVYSTYLGGAGVSDPVAPFAGADYGTAVAVDGDGNAYVAGYAHSKNYPITPGAYQTTNKADSSLNDTGASNTNAVITKLDVTGSALIYSTYLGGTGNPYYGDEALGIAVDFSGNAYVTGQAGSQDFPVTPGAFQTVYQESVYAWSGFVTKLNSTGTDLWYSTYLGGSTPAGGRPGDTTAAIALDGSGDAYVTGTVYSLEFPVTPGAYQAKNKENQNGGANYYSGNAFMTEVNTDGSDLVYSSYLGGSGSPDGGGGDSGAAIAVDAAGNAYITGATLSCKTTSGTPFPTTSGAFQTFNAACKAGNPDATNAFISKFGASSSYKLIGTTTTVTSSLNSQKQGGQVTFTAKVQPASGDGIAAGAVGFSVDASPNIYVVLGDTGEASYSTTALTPGEHTIIATFHGDVDYKSSEGSTREKITGPPAFVAVVSGATQTAIYGSAFASPLVVVVQDSEGNPVVGATVAFTGAGLKFSGDSATTGSNGEASVAATAIAVGKLTATASVAGVPGVASFPLMATKALLTVSANDASAFYNQPLPKFTYTGKGYLNGDTSTVLTGSPAETTTAKQGSLVGTYLIAISQGTLSAANYSFGFVDGVLTINPIGTTATPAFSVPAGSYSSAKTVKIADTTSDAAIYYTANGTMPTTSSTKYTTAGIQVSATETIKAIAVAAGHSQSAVASAAYTIH